MGDYVIESLDSGLRLLSLLATHDTLSVTEAASLLDVSRATAHRVLSTLEARGFVTRRGARGGYCTGPELTRLGTPAGLDDATRARLAPILDDALRRTENTLEVVSLLGTRILVTDGRESPRPVRVTLERGKTHAAHATSGGKVLLSFLTDDQVRLLYPHETLPAVTDRTITSREELLEELAQVRRRGWASSVGESVPGMDSVAVPLTGAHGHDRLAVMASAPATGDTPFALARRAALLRLATRARPHHARPAQGH
ncbi:IclR family transcriptional regulator [Streptomyces sp. NPDC002088]|uniref:IclR family transcriptional regulator n=1 Tax=Streptomyces sp. NPDC002088 TaxID=3154665 RepID=UPI003321C491